MNLLTTAGIAVFTKRVLFPLAKGTAQLGALAVRATALPFIALAGIHVRRVPPPPIYRGTSTQSGRPLQTFQDSINDLQGG